MSDLGNLAARRPAVLIATATRAPAVLRERAAELARALALDELGAGEAYRLLRGQAAAWLREGAGFDPDSGPGRKATEVTLAAQGIVVPVGGPAAGELVLISAPRRRAATGAGEPVTLAEHGAAVEERARADAQRAGLGPQASETIALAARHHDVGKRDPRFQAWLAEGAPQPGVPLAKSGAAGRDRRRREAARQAAGWPAGKRHELLSAAAVARVGDWRNGVDPELLAHLVVAHHGYGRPFFALVDDPQPPRLELELDGRRLMLDGDAMPDWRQHAERFARLQARYGAWGLALLEAVLVLADRSVSAVEGGG